MDDQTLRETKSLIQGQFELDAPEEDPLSEVDFLNLLANRIGWMIEHDIELLFSTLYRMDVSEEAVALAMHPNAPELANVGLARLVLERQKQRVETKRSYRQPPIDEDGEWEW